MATRDQKLAWLAEAEQAYHKLNMGQRARVFVDQNGERIEYDGATRGQLLSYINELKRDLGLTSIPGPSTVII